MPLLTDIPCELIASILQSLDDLQSLTPALLSCRHIYSSYKQNPNIAAAILRQKVTPALLPYSVAAWEAFSLPRPRDSATVQGLLDALYEDSAKFANRATSLPMSSLIEMSRTHEVIQAMVTAFANDAWEGLRQADDNLPPTVSLSATERFRFSRAFYRLQMFYGFFNTTSTSNADFEDKINSWFFFRHPLWENEQINCVHDFLEAKVAKASFDVLAHDVDFGEYEVDYLSTGEDNYMRQKWLSCGIEFVYQLINENSYDVKNDMLATIQEPDKGTGIFPRMLGAILDAYQDANAFVGPGSEEELLYENADRVTNEDPDKGPFRSWYPAHEGAPLFAGLNLYENGLLRDCAYVLWDWDRVEKHDLLKTFEKISGPRPEPDGKEYDEMAQSFVERSLIWQKGGHGYWSKGDTSGVWWPEKSVPKQA